MGGGDTSLSVIIKIRAMEEKSKIVKTKVLTWKGKEYTATLTEEDVDKIKHKAIIAKLNGFGKDWFMDNVRSWVREEFPDECSEIFDATEAKVEVGTPATENLYIDHRAKTVVEVISPTKIVVAENETKCIDYYAGEYEVLDEIAEYMSKETFTLRKGGTWVQEGQPKKSGSVTLTLGFRRHYIDPSF